MKLKVGDFVEFKKYEDMNDDEKAFITEESFPEFGKVKEVQNDGSFLIKNCGYVFNPKAVATVISGGNSFNPGDEVLVKATVKMVFKGSLQIDSMVDDADVVKVVKHMKPNCFIVREKKYGLYLGYSGDLVRGKDSAKLYSSRIAADEDAGYMYLRDWSVIPYGD